MIRRKLQNGPEENTAKFIKHLSFLPQRLLENQDVLESPQCPVSFTSPEMLDQNPFPLQKTENYSDVSQFTVQPKQEKENLNYLEEEKKYVNEEIKIEEINDPKSIEERLLFPILIYAIIHSKCPLLLSSISYIK
jgi:hypothetical protein